jgi:hypothetical protein
VASLPSAVTIRCGGAVRQLDLDPVLRPVDQELTDERGEPAATATFTHVFVDRATRKPTPIDGRLRDALERLRRDEPARARQA